LASAQFMRNLPLVTAIVATYNRANLVGKVIESILGQTYQNIGVVVVDDGSTDDTPNVLRQFGDRIRPIYQDNAGPGAARNRGIAAARGEIVAFLDSDARNEVKIAFSDHSKAERIFGKRTKTPLSEGVRAMAAWVREHGARESCIFEGIEVLRNMPPSWAKVVSAKV
jgi:glycosyltransferase involved in cell wall biosynthesis